MAQLTNDSNRSFISYNDPILKRGLNLTDTSMPMDAKPTPGMVMMPDGRAYLVEKGRRGGERVFGSEGEDYVGGTEDWMWRDQKTGQEHYLSDYLSQGAKLYDTSEGGLSSLLEREGRGVFNRGGSKQGDWGASMSNLDPNQVSGSQNHWDTANMADDADSLGYLTRINPTVRKQIFDAAGVSMPANTSALSSDDIAKLERTIYKIDPMSFGGGYTGEMGNEMYGQASMGGVDPMYGRRTANKKGEYFKNPENLKFDPNYGLYNDGSAGFVGRPKQSAWQQGMPFMAAAAALMGGAAFGAFGADAAMGAGMEGLAGAEVAEAGLSDLYGGSMIGTGDELGFGNMLLDSNIGSGAGLAAEEAFGVGMMDPFSYGGEGGSFLSDLFSGKNLTKEAIKSGLQSLTSGGKDGKGGSISSDVLSAIIGNYYNGKQQDGLRDDADSIYNKFVPPWLQDWDQNLASEFGRQMPNVGTLADRVINAGDASTNPYLSDSRFYMDKLRSYYEDPSNFEADPGYVFSRDEDLAAAEAAAAARGYNNSGRLMAELGDRANKLSYTHLADASNRLNTYGKDSHAAGIADQQAATQALRAYTGGMGDLSNLFQRYNPSNASTGYVNALTNARSVQGDNNASIAGVGGKVLGNVVGKGLDKLFEGW